MAEPDKIDGIPGMMKSFDTDKGSPNATQFITNDEKNTFRSVMEEGQAFVAKDNTATEALTKFVQDVGHRFRSDTITARAHGQDYETADKNGADKINNAVFGNIYAPNLGQKPVI
jgi:hypothetical protein